MRFPWVALATMERLLEMAERAHAETRADLLAERARSAGLTATIVRLKRDGAVLLPQTPAKQEHRKPSPLEQAIDDNPRSRRVPGLQAHLLRWGEEEVKRGVDQELVVERLRTWGDPTAEDDAETEETL